jgi:hypothetical protein
MMMMMMMLSSETPDDFLSASFSDTLAPFILRNHPHLGPF